MSDKIQIHDSLSSLDSESRAEPYKFGLSKNKIITFKSPEDMPWQEAEAFMSLVDSENNASISDVLEKWLSAEDYQKLSDENLSLKQVSGLIQKVTKHFESFFGTAGEG